MLSSVVEMVFLDTDEYLFPVDVRRSAHEALRRAEPPVRSKLPMLARRITLTVYPTRRVIPETGYTGFTPSKDWIQLSVNPWDAGGIETVFENALRSCFAHEAHHAARYVAAGPAVFDDRVISAAVFEGLATAFEEEITGKLPAWGLYDAVEADEWIEELRQLAPGTNSRPWRFLHPDGRRWIAYRAGKRIIDRAKHATGRTAADLVAISTDDVLAVIDEP